MLNQESLSILQSLVISGAGMLVVLAELSVLAVAIKVFTGILSIFHKDDTEILSGAVSGNDSGQDRNYAVIMTVMNEELNAEGLKYKVTSIREMDR